MASYEPVSARGWRARAVRRLQRLADVLDDDETDGEVAEAELVDTEDVDDDGAIERIETADVFETAAPNPLTAERKAAARRAEFRAVVKEVYPTVAPAIVALAEGGCDADLDEWLTVARLLYDDVTHRDGGLSAEARERALRAAAAQALEAQARSSARLAGYSDAEQDELSSIEGDAVGTRVWEHYLCREAKLVRENLHGETLGHWLSALGELWAAASRLYELDTGALTAADAHILDDAEVAEDAHIVDGGSPGTDVVPAPVVASPVASAVNGESPEHEHARVALKAALTRVEELALW
jgi:hypothetical protein